MRGHRRHEHGLFAAGLQPNFQQRRNAALHIRRQLFKMPMVIRGQAAWAATRRGTLPAPRSIFSSSTGFENSRLFDSLQRQRTIKISHPRRQPRSVFRARPSLQPQRKFARNRIFSAAGQSRNRAIGQRLSPS